MDDLLPDALQLAKDIRALVRSENTRVHEARMTGKDVSDCGSRDEADMLQTQLYKDWPAKRLDALIAALRARHALSVNQPEQECA